MAQTAEQSVKVVALAIAEAIRELKEVPSGHLYAHLMNVMDLNTYQAILGVLERAGVIRVEKSYLIVWIGREKA